MTAGNLSWIEHGQTWSNATRCELLAEYNQLLVADYWHLNLFYSALYNISTAVLLYTCFTNLHGCTEVFNDLQGDCQAFRTDFYFAIIYIYIYTIFFEVGRAGSIMSIWMSSILSGLFIQEAVLDLAWSSSCSDEPWWTHAIRCLQTVDSYCSWLMSMIFLDVHRPQSSVISWDFFSYRMLHVCFFWWCQVWVRKNNDNLIAARGHWNHWTLQDGTKLDQGHHHRFSQMMLGPEGETCTLRCARLGSNWIKLQDANHRINA